MKKNTYCITLFHFKLDTKNDVIVDHDILVNFGNYGLRTIFDMDSPKQKLLLDALIEYGMSSYIFLEQARDFQFVLDPTHRSMRQLLNEMHLKDQVCLFSRCRYVLDHKQTEKIKLN